MCRRTGLQPCGWHVLRHTFASHMAMRGVPLKAIQELLGHSSMEMTLRYTHLSRDTYVNAVDILVAGAQAYGNMAATRHPRPEGRMIGDIKRVRSTIT
ncbi:MAG: integrase [Deltaproteobacteria bacterium]|nr:MAG: integrase [Deltaproteobacteria bacterium]